MQRYEPKTIEPKWQKIWADSKLYEVTEDTEKQKIYASPMLPYPSGTGLHTGHVRNYSISDAVARYHRQKGYNTMTNIGWDAFGLPAENFAIKTGTPPAVSTAKNIAYFKKQLLRLGMSFDWSREFDTSDPSYYKWTQWVFGLMYKRGLAYKAEKSQWWCEKCNTVLADEQVTSAGKCWRHDGPDDPEVKKKKVNQWFFKITDYADEILDATDALAWPEKIKTMQKNWIGRSVGAEVDFRIDGSDQILKVFTTRPDTLYGVTFMVVAPEHELLETLVPEEQRAVVDAYVTSALKKSEVERQENKEKTGVFSGIYAINPVNNEKVPVWVADYVLSTYGTGAIMAVPAHDERDNEFAKQFSLPIKEVVYLDGNEASEAEDIHHGEGVMKNSGPYDGRHSEEVREAIVADLTKQGVAAEKTTYKMRDWLISRQRYWGAPVPIVYCPDHGAVLVPEDQLPVKLPEVENYVPDGKNSSVLAGVASWVNTTCPTCGKPAKRETDTMDGYVCSTWYLHRYTDARNDQQAFDPAKANYWFPLDFYFGADHAVAHLLYVRFFQKVLCDAGLAEEREPVKRLIFNGYINAEDGRKMSKSLGNTVDPMDIIESGYGADALRLFELFIAPYEQDTSWNSKGVPGCYRFLNRYWTLVQEFAASKDEPSGAAQEQILRIAHKTIKKVTEDMESLSFNTAVAAMMTAVNELYLIKAEHAYAAREAWQFALEALAQCLGPFTPHISEEVWHQLGHEDSVHIGHWPSFDHAHLVSETVTIVVQVNGKVRARLEVPASSGEATVVAAARNDEKVKAHMPIEPKKTIYVPNRLVNFVV